MPKRTVFVVFQGSADTRGFHQAVHTYTATLGLLRWKVPSSGTAPTTDFSVVYANGKAKGSDIPTTGVFSAAVSVKADATGANVLDGLHIAARAAGRGGRVVMVGHGTDEGNTWGVEIQPKDDINDWLLDYQHLQALSGIKLGGVAITVVPHFRDYFNEAKGILSSWGIDEIEQFSCRAGANDPAQSVPAVQLLSNLYGVKVRAYFTYVAIDGTAVMLSRTATGGSPEAVPDTTSKNGAVSWTTGGPAKGQVWVPAKSSP